MLTPQYLQWAPAAMVDLYGEVEAAILEDMARRINGYDMFIPAAQHQLRMLEEMGVVREEIMGQLARLTRKSNRELEQIMREAGMETIRADDMVYRAAGFDPAPLSASPIMQRTLQAGLTKTKGLFDNLTRTTANTASRQFERALDAAYMQVTSGAFGPQEAVKRAVRDLCKQGVAAIDYPSGRRDSMDVAVRRAVVTGVNQTAMQLQTARADELGVDLVETTAHAGARPAHAEWQGQVFSRSGKSQKYPDFVSVTGYGTGPGLGGWNCSHSFRPYVEGMPRTYSKELLREYEAQDYEYNGQKMTEYETLQRQREIERNIRRWKRENQAMKALGVDTTESAAKIKHWQDTQKDFLQQTGLKRQGSREQVAGFSRSEAGRASHDARVWQAMQKDAIMKKTNGLPKKLEVDNRSLGHTLEVTLPGLSGIVPKGAEVGDVRVIAGMGTAVELRDWKRLYNLYGGDPSLWQKRSGVVRTQNYSYELHWYERNGTMPEGEAKIKRVKKL